VGSRRVCRRARCALPAQARLVKQKEATLGASQVGGKAHSCPPPLPLLHLRLRFPLQAPTWSTVGSCSPAAAQ
jgi:hypothetical protein